MYNDCVLIAGCDFQSSFEPVTFKYFDTRLRWIASQNDGYPADTLWMKKAEEAFFSAPSTAEGYYEVIEVLWQKDTQLRKDFFPWA